MLETTFVSINVQNITRYLRRMFFQQGIFRCNGPIRKGQGMAGARDENAEHGSLDSCWICSFSKYCQQKNFN